MVAMCSTALLVAWFCFFVLHNCLSGSTHGAGASLTHCVWSVHRCHMAASLSNAAIARMSCGHTSCSLSSRPWRSLKTSYRGQLQPIRAADIMHAPAGPVTLDHLRCRPTAFCCWYHASSSSSAPMVLSHMAADQATIGAASHSCCTSALCMASLSVVERPKCCPGRQLETTLRKDRMCPSAEPIVLQP